MNVTVAWCVVFLALLGCATGENYGDFLELNDALEICEFGASQVQNWEGGPADRVVDLTGMLDWQRPLVIYVGWNHYDHAGPSNYDIIEIALAWGERDFQGAELYYWDSDNIQVESQSVGTLIKVFDLKDFTNLRVTDEDTPIALELRSNKNGVVWDGLEYSNEIGVWQCNPIQESTPTILGLSPETFYALAFSAVVVVLVVGGVCLASRASMPGSERVIATSTKTLEPSSSGSVSAPLPTAPPAYESIQSTQSTQIKQ